MKKLYICTDQLFEGGVRTMLLNVYSGLANSNLSEKLDIYILVTSDLNVDKLEKDIRDKIIIKEEINFQKLEIKKTKEFMNENTDNYFLCINYYFAAKMLLLSRVFNINFNCINSYSGYLPEVKGILKKDSSFPVNYFRMALNIPLNYVQKYVKYSLFLNERMQQYSIKKYKIDINNTKIVPPFVSKDFVNTSISNIITNEIHINARVIRSKGFEQLCTLCELLIDKIDFKIIVNGDGNYRKTLENQINSRGLSNYIELRGFSPIINSLPKAKYLLSLSQSEGMPLNIMEALALGVPVIAYDCPTGPAELVNDENGILVELNNVKKISEVIIQNFDRQWDREAIKKNHLLLFNEKKCSDAYYEFINDIIELDR